jgi:uncharacterized protein (UPF0261 family)
MARAAAEETGAPGTVIGATMLGLTTPCVLRAKELLEEAGYELVAFHPNGTGGRSMERLVEEGVIDGVLDISTQELAGRVGRVAGGLFDAGPERLSAAGRRGIPQVVAPGGTDYVVLGPLDDLTGEQRARPLIVHNPNITLVRTSRDEMVAVGRLMARQLNGARGPAAVVVPLGGFSYSDRPGHAFYDPMGDALLVDALEQALDPRIEVFKIDAHVNDTEFAAAAVGVLRSLMEGTDGS